MDQAKSYTAGKDDESLTVFQYIPGKGTRYCIERHGELICDCCDSVIANEGTSIKIGHKCWNCQSQVTRIEKRKKGTVMSQVYPPLPDFRSHSELLNRILWRMALHLGDARPGDSSIDADIEELADRFFKKLDSKVTHIVAGDDQWEPTPEELSELIDLFKTAENDPVRSLLVTRSGVTFKQEESEHDSVLRYKASIAPKT